MARLLWKKPKMADEDCGSDGLGMASVTIPSLNSYSSSGISCLF